MAIRDGRRRTAGRPAWRTAQVVRVARGGKPAGAGEFGGVGLTQDQRTGGPQGADGRRVGIGPSAGIDRRVVLRGHVGRIEDVLYANRYTVQRATVGSLVQLTGFADHGIMIDIGPGSDIGITRRATDTRGRGPRRGYPPRVAWCPPRRR